MLEVTLMAHEPAILTEQIIPPPALGSKCCRLHPAQGERAGRRFFQFFTTTIRNRNTRMAYAHAVKQFFDWCEDHRLGLEDIEPVASAAYIEELGTAIARPSVKQHLAAIRQLFDYLVTGGILLSNPAGSVRGNAIGPWKPSPLMHH
jgi:site-specific recombinase XerD